MAGFDGGREIDWGKTSEDYARHRPGPPQSFYDLLEAHGVGLPGQRLVDVGTGTGVLAREFARRGLHVSGVDVAQGQIAMAQALAKDERLDIDFGVAPAEHTGLPSQSFDILTASQCWIYFEPEAIRAEIQRLLVPGGRVVISHFSFLPRQDPIVAASEALVLKYNPDWAGADWDGETLAIPDLGISGSHLRAFFRYDEAIPFTRDRWKGRMRALRGTGATLDAATLAKFDADHDALLKDIAGEPFTILHRIDAHVFELPS